MTHLKITAWRSLFARLPLPMLALAASYGVYKFNVLFVPSWVALVAAAAFELTYVGLAVAELDKRQRWRAHAIAITAVIVSVVYNSLHGLFELRPALLVHKPLWADIALAVLHGLPLAVVAYNSAVLLLHSQHPDDDQADDQAVSTSATTVLHAAREEVFPAPVHVRVEPEQCSPVQEVAEVSTETCKVSGSARNKRVYACPSCERELTLGQYGAACRLGYCKHCKEES